METNFFLIKRSRNLSVQMNTLENDDFKIEIRGVQMNALTHKFLNGQKRLVKRYFDNPSEGFRKKPGLRPVKLRATASLSPAQYSLCV